MIKQRHLYTCLHINKAHTTYSHVDSYMVIPNLTVTKPQSS